ncbi:MAG: C25 family cysteine peptidase [Candidatus Zixiibacteriota bacterium]
MKRMTAVILVLTGLGAVAMTDNTGYRVKSFQETIVVSEPVIKHWNQYVIVTADEAAAVLSKAGEPVLPVVEKVFTLPLGSKVRQVDVSFSQPREIKLSKQVQPGPEPVPKTGTQRVPERVRNDEIYRSAELYPSDSFRYTVGAGIKGNERVIFLKVHCYPVRYSPGLNTLHYSERIDMRVTYDEPTAPVSFPDVYDMVIITPGTFSDELQPLIAHKNSRGVQTVLKTTEEIYAEYPGRDMPEQIKYFIRDAIETWGIDYVLLVGGAAYLPCRYTHIYFDYDYQDYWVFPSDLYYADVYDDSLNFCSWDDNENDLFAEYNWYGSFDTLDLYPDVYLGRLACVDATQVNTCVNKIITYETGEAHTQDWFTNLVLIGGDSLPGDAEAVDEGEYVNQHVADTLDGFIQERVWASNGLLWQASNISNAINSGAGFTFFNGHGHTTVWATHPHESSQWIPPGNYTNSHINALVNGNELPIVVSDACYHCQYDVAPHCFGWTFLTNPNGGAIAYLGGTDIDVSYAGTAIITKGIERLCLIMSGNYKGGDATFGELWAHGVTDYINPVMDEIDYITLEEFQPFGDPSLVIAGDSEKPAKPATPMGETEGGVELEYTYTSSTTDPDGDSLYYLFGWGDETYSEWLGPYASGDPVEASHTWADTGSYEITVIAKDENGVFSESSDSLFVNICLRYGDANGDMIIDVGDVVFLVNYLYKGDAPPNPPEVGDCNFDQVINIGDVVFLINYLYKGGDPPGCP